MLNIPTALLQLAHETEAELQPIFSKLNEISIFNHQKVLAAFTQNRISEYHLKGSTGYGYDDLGREAIEACFAAIFRADKALVRNQIVSGTHAIALCLFGVLRPGDHLLSVTGDPYDTLHEVIGLPQAVPGSLADWGVDFDSVPLSEQGLPSFPLIAEAMRPNTKMIYIQRSRGYAWRPSININQISAIIDLVKEVNPNVVVFVDNCYGELVEKQEPTEVGADLVAGSLIKNLGGGLAPTGGYVVGRADLVDAAANRWTAPGIGAAVGATFNFNAAFLQGLYLAPKTVSEAVKGAVFASGLLNKLGFETSPATTEPRTDLIQAVKLNSPEAMIAFCRGLQKASPIDGHVRPEPGDMPGYDDQVIMAGGTFTQGATMEMSADGPIRPPYIIYFQGGLSYEYIKIGLLSAISEIPLHMSDNIM